MLKFFSTYGMYKIPVKGEYFRVGYNLGRCIFSCKHFVMMKIVRE